MNLANNPSLHQQIAAWSDEHLVDARNFIRGYADLIPRDLTNAQLYGLANIARNVTNFSQLTEFVKNQAQKAERANRSKMVQFWQAVRDKLVQFHDAAQNISRESKSALTSEQVHLLLGQRFIQHMIAESLVTEKSHQQKQYR